MSARLGSRKYSRGWGGKPRRVQALENLSHASHVGALEELAQQGAATALGGADEVGETLELAESARRCVPPSHQLS